MGSVTRVQIIQRANDTRQFYLIFPAPLAEALEMQKGEPIEWVVKDKQTIEIRRQGSTKRREGRPHER